MAWETVYRSTDQTIEQQVTGEGEDAVIEERVTWHRDTPERIIEQLRGQVAVTDVEEVAGIAVRIAQQALARANEAHDRLDAMEAAK